MPSKVGEVCRCCQPKWEKAGKPLLKLVALPAVTPDRPTVAVCLFCDAPVIENAKATIDAR